MRELLAKPTLARIRADAQRVGGRLRPLLETIASRLFDDGFNVDALWRDHGITDRSASVLFHELKTTPKVYIETARHEVAERLLRETGFPIWLVAQMLGLAERTFTRVFKKRTGRTAEEFRQSGGPKRSFDLDARLAKGLVGELSEAQDADLRETLKDATVRVRSLRPSDETPIDTVRESELYHVEVAIWPRLAGLPFAEQRELVRDCRPFFTPVFYDFLHRRSREEGRRDRQRGVDLAQLALATVEANEKYLEDLYPVLRPQARAWIGNARRLALDFFRADDDIRVAVDLLRHTSDPFAAGIVYLCRGTLRMFQRRHEEAIADYDVALPSFEAVGETSWLIRTLNGRASALYYGDQLGASIETLQKAKKLSSGSGAILLEIEYDLTLALLASKRLAEARENITALERLANLDERPLTRCLIEWVTGNVCEEYGEYEAAEKAYLTASEGLGRLGEPIYSGLLFLDLAVMYTKIGRTREVPKLARDVYLIFSSARLCDETLASVRLLKNAVPSGVDLQAVRFCLQHDPLVALHAKGR